MTPAFLVDKFGPKLARVVAGVVLLLLVGALLLVTKCMNDRANETSIKLGKNQTEAAQASGQDAVDTVAGVSGSESEIDRVTRENRDEIDKAEGSTAAVNPDVRAAGLRALCQREAYRSSHPECMQQPAP